MIDKFKIGLGIPTEKNCVYRFRLLAQCLLGKLCPARRQNFKWNLKQVTLDLCSPKSIYRIRRIISRIRVVDNTKAENGARQVRTCSKIKQEVLSRQTYFGLPLSRFACFAKLRNSRSHTYRSDEIDVIVIFHYNPQTHPHPYVHQTDIYSIIYPGIVFVYDNNVPFSISNVGHIVGTYR